MPDASPLPEKSPLAHSIQPPKQSPSSVENDELREADFATRATVPGDNASPAGPVVPGKPKDPREESFVEPELMKDESEDRE